MIGLAGVRNINRERNPMDVLCSQYGMSQSYRRVVSYNGLMVHGGY